MRDWSDVVRSVFAFIFGTLIVLAIGAGLYSNHAYGPSGDDDLDRPVLRGQ